MSLVRFRRRGRLTLSGRSRRGRFTSVRTALYGPSITSKRRRRGRSGFNRRSRYTKNSPLPDTIFTKLTYQTDYDQNSGGAAIQLNQWQPNNLNKPDYTSAGHQPMGYNQLEALYNHYTVYGFKYEIQVTNKDQPESALNAMIVFSFSRSVTAPSTIAQAVEQPGFIKQILLPPNHKETIRGYCDLSRFIGKSVYKDEDYQADTGSAPSKGMYLNVISQDVNETTAIALSYCFRFTFYVRYNAPKLLAQS